MARRGQERRSKVSRVKFSQQHIHQTKIKTGPHNFLVGPAGGGRSEYGYRGHATHLILFGERPKAIYWSSPISAVRRTCTSSSFAFHSTCRSGLSCLQFPNSGGAMWDCHHPNNPMARTSRGRERKRAKERGKKINRELDKRCHRHSF